MDKESCGNTYARLLNIDFRVLYQSFLHLFLSSYSYFLEVFIRFVRVFDNIYLQSLIYKSIIHVKITPDKN